MTPDTFDELTRLWSFGSSRRVFLLQVTGLALAGLFRRAGIRVPDWLPPRNHAQCFINRAGVACGECGICQGGQCVGFSDSACANSNRPWLAAPGGARCARCDRGSGTCMPCGKDQKCCKDGCCDGACTKDGGCCPPDKVCGETCCEDCEVCQDGTCVRQASESKCPPNYTLIVTPPAIEGCCVCTQGLCGDQCCSEKEACLDGKCCKRCGLDGAICCDPLICCRERCHDPTEPCCPCMEDISPEEGQKVLDESRKTIEKVTREKIKYGQDRTKPDQMDCTLFVETSLRNALGDANKGLSSRTLDGNCNFRRLKQGEEPRAGDILSQPRDSGLPGSQHAGVSQGTKNSKGGHLGTEMGSDVKKQPGTGAKENSVWGIPRSEGGWFDYGFEMNAYRPQKPCKKK